MDPRNRFKPSLLKPVGGSNEGGGCRRSSSESDVTGPDVNPAYSIIPGGDLNPSNILSNNQGGSIPNLSGSNAGYTSTPSGLGISSRLRSRGTDKQGPDLEQMHQAIIAEFSDIKLQVMALQNVINSSTIIRQEEIERIYNSFTTRIDDLTNRCIIGRIDFKIHSEIIQLVPNIKRARKAHLNKIGILIDETRRNGVEEDEDNAFLEDDLFADPSIDRLSYPKASTRVKNRKSVTLPWTGFITKLIRMRNSLQKTSEF